MKEEKVSVEAFIAVLRSANVAKFEFAGNFPRFLLFLACLFVTIVVEFPRPEPVCLPGRMKSSPLIVEI